jgi:hypothetical protein
MALPPNSDENGGGVATEEDTTIDIHTTHGTPIRYLPLDHLYSSTSPCSGSSNVMSKKVKARKLNNEIQFNNGEIDSQANDDEDDEKEISKTTTSSMVVYAKPPVLYVYSRRRKRSSFPASDSERTALKRRRIGCNELESLGIDWNALGKFDGPRLRECRNQIGNSAGFDGKSSNKKKFGSGVKLPKLMPDSYTLKRWVT